LLDVKITSKREVDFDSDSDYLFAGLGEESSFLTFEEVAGRAWTHFEVVWWCRRKHRHQVVTCWWSRIFAQRHVGCMAKVEF
jgi:hypothetical protein